MSVYRVNTGGFMTTLRKDVGTALRVHCRYIDGFREYDSFTQRKIPSVFGKGDPAKKI